MELNLLTVDLYAETGSWGKATHKNPSSRGDKPFWLNQAVKSEGFFGQEIRSQFGFFPLQQKQPTRGELVIASPIASQILVYFQNTTVFLGINTMLFPEIRIAAENGEKKYEFPFWDPAYFPVRLLLDWLWLVGYSRFRIDDHPRSWSENQDCNTITYTWICS